MNKTKFVSHKKIHNKWMEDSKYRYEYEKLEPEFQIAKTIIEARTKKHFSQAQLAKKINTGQAVISRLENMNGKPSLSFLQRVAEALQLKLEIRFLPQ